MTHLPSWDCLSGNWVGSMRSGKHTSHVQGSSTVLYAALSPELEGRNVLYLHACKEAQASKLAQDPALAQQLWDASERAVGSR